MRCESAEAFWAVRCRGLMSPPHQGDSLRLEDPEPSSLRSLQVFEDPESAEAALYAPRASADSHLAPHQALSEVFSIYDFG